MPNHLEWRWCSGRRVRRKVAHVDEAFDTGITGGVDHILGDDDVDTLKGALAVFPDDGHQVDHGVYTGRGDAQAVGMRVDIAKGKLQQPGALTRPPYIPHR